jgi:hypothetical protein
MGHRCQRSFLGLGLTFDIPGLRTGVERARSTPGSIASCGSSLFRMHAREVPAAAGGRYLVPTCRVDKDNGHVAIAGEHRSSTVLRATGFSQCHRHHVPVRVEVADDQACLWLGQLLPDPGHPVNAGGLEPGDVSGVPDADSRIVICRKPKTLG